MFSTYVVPRKIISTGHKAGQGKNISVLFKHIPFPQTPRTDHQYFPCKLFMPHSCRRRAPADRLWRCGFLLLAVVHFFLLVMQWGWPVITESLRVLSILYSSNGIHICAQGNVLICCFSRASIEHSQGKSSAPSPSEMCAQTPAHRQTDGTDHQKQDQKYQRPCIATECRNSSVLGAVNMAVLEDIITFGKHISSIN